MLRHESEKTYLDLRDIALPVTSLDDRKLERADGGLLALGDALGGVSGLLGDALGGLEASRGVGREGGDGREDGDGVLHIQWIK